MNEGIRNPQVESQEHQLPLQRPQTQAAEVPVAAEVSARESDSQPLVSPVLGHPGC